MQNERYEYYSNNLSNFKVVLQDTAENIVYFDEDDYNCMGYALGTFEWDEPVNFVSIYEEGYDDVEDVAYRCVEEIKCYENVRIISSIDELEIDEYMIAFRTGCDDFHFVRQNSDGSWTHKKGSGIIEEIEEKEVFSDIWCAERAYPYISKIYYFAVRY